MTTTPVTVVHGHRVPPRGISSPSTSSPALKRGRHQSFQHLMRERRGDRRAPALGHGGLGIDNAVRGPVGGRSCRSWTAAQGPFVFPAAVRRHRRASPSASSASVRRFRTTTIGPSSRSTASGPAFSIDFDHPIFTKRRPSTAEIDFSTVPAVKESARAHLSASCATSRCCVAQPGVRRFDGQRHRARR